MEPGGVGRDGVSGRPTAVQAPGHVYNERERRGGEGGRERTEGRRGGRGGRGEGEGGGGGKLDKERRGSGSGRRSRRE